MKIYEACILAMAISLTLLAAFAVLGAVVHRWRLGKLKEGKRVSRALISFYLMVVGFFLSAVIVYFPVYYYGMLAAQSGFVRFLNSVLLGMQNVLRLFTLNGEFDNVMQFIEANFAEAAGAGVAYSVYMSLIMVAAPALTAGFLISFFREISSYIKYLFYPNADLYILSELNEMSIALAEDIATSRKKGERRRLIVFTDVFSKGDEEDYELISRAKGIGAICLRKDITELWLKPLRGKVFRKFYFIGVDHDENLQQGLTLIRRFRGGRYDNTNTELYIFSDNSESETLLNSAFEPYEKIEESRRDRTPIVSNPASEKYTIEELLRVPSKGMKVRRISENRNLVLSTLQDSTWLFTRADQTDKHIKVALVGLGGYGTELLKALCWYTQMPGYSVEIHIYDAAKETKDRISSIAPELIARSGVAEEGECFYDIRFHCPVDVTGMSFYETFREDDKGLTAVFVTLGDDERNIEAAMRIRMQLGRDLPKEEVPPVYAVVYSTTKTAVTGKELRDIRGDAYGITFIGDLKTRYSLASIECAKLEDLAKRCHLEYTASYATKTPKPGKLPPEDRVRKSIYQFEHYEYYRRSSMAQAVYLETFYRLNVLHGNDRLPDEENEHKRWNAYMRSEGYICGERDDISKRHCDLRPFPELGEWERQRDDTREMYMMIKEKLEAQPKTEPGA